MWENCRSIVDRGDTMQDSRQLSCNCITANGSSVLYTCDMILYLYVSRDNESIVKMFSLREYRTLLNRSE